MEDAYSIANTSSQRSPFSQDPTQANRNPNIPNSFNSANTVTGKYEGQNSNPIGYFNQSPANPYQSQYDQGLTNRYNQASTSYQAMGTQTAQTSALPDPSKLQGPSNPYSFLQGQFGSNPTSFLQGLPHGHMGDRNQRNSLMQLFSMMGLGGFNPGGQTGQSGQGYDPSIHSQQHPGYDPSIKPYSAMPNYDPSIHPQQTNWFQSLLGRQTP